MTHPGHFPRPPEIKIAKLRQHGRRVVFPSLVLIAAAGFIGYCSRGLREGGDWLLWAVLAGIVALLFGIVPILAWLRNRYEVTNYRTIERRGLLASKKRELPHHQVLRVRMRRNWLQALFGSGTIDLTAVDGRVFSLRDVPNSVTAFQALRELTGSADRDLV